MIPTSMFKKSPTCLLAKIQIGFIFSLSNVFPLSPSLALCSVNLKIFVSTDTDLQCVVFQLFRVICGLFVASMNNAHIDLIHELQLAAYFYGAIFFP